ELDVTLGRARDAGLAFGRIVWELPIDEARGRVHAWVEGEARLRNVAAPALVTAMLALRTPSRDEVRALASQVVLAALDARGGGPGAPSTERRAPFDLHRVQVWLDQNDDNLDIRSLWLARHALSRLTGGDRLALARARDRVLQKLARGLSLERDVPTFLR